MIKIKALLYFVFTCVIAQKITDQVDVTFRFETDPVAASIDHILNVQLSPKSSFIGSTGELVGVLVFLPQGVLRHGLSPNRSTCERNFATSDQRLSKVCEGLGGDSTELLSLVSSSSSTSTPLPLVYSTPQGLMLTFDSVVSMDTIELYICCFEVPSFQDSVSTQASIVPITIPSTRRLAASDWYQLRLQFDPPSSNSLTTVSIVIQLTSSLPAGSRMVFTLPGLSCGDTQIQFTVTTGYTAIFLDMASWTQSTNALVFQSASTLPASTPLTLTLLNLFQLPVTSALNSPAYTARILNSVNTVIVTETSFFQSDQVYSDAVFLFSSLTILNAPPVVTIGNSPSASIANELAMTNGQIVRDIQLTFSANRPIFVGQTLVLLLPGYQAGVREISLQGPLTPYISQHEAIFDPSSTIATMELISPLFFDGSGTDKISVTFPNITIPLAQYLNDGSVKIGVTEFADQEIASVVLTPIQQSPEVNVLGVGKTFLVSAISFDPKIPETSTSMTITIRPSVPFFEKSVLRIHLPGGFSRTVNLGSIVQLQGGDAALFETAIWDSLATTLTLTLATEAVIPTNKNTTIQIGLDQGFVLPPALSENDKSLKIESVSNSIIHLESLRNSPPFGPQKGLVSTSSSLTLLPATSLALTTITITMVFNCQVHDGSTVFVHLGGFTSNFDRPMIDAWKAAGSPAASTPTRTVHFSPADAVILNSLGTWDIFAQIFSFKIASVANPAIPIGTKTQFTIPKSEEFLNPFTLSINDPSVWLTIPESGIVEKQFFENHELKNLGTQKTFQLSEIFYGNPNNPLPPIPNTPMSIVLKLWPTFDILPGSIIRFILPGFVYPFSFSKVFITEPTASAGLAQSSLDLPQFGTNYRAFEFDGKNFFGSWNNETSTLEFRVQNGSIVSYLTPTVIWIQTGFVTPSAKLINDVSLQIEVAGNQILAPQQIRNSPAIATREFKFSTISFTPQRPLVQTKIETVLVPSVDIVNGTVFTLGLPGFEIPALSNSINLVLIESGIDCVVVVNNSAKNAPCFGTWHPPSGEIFIKINSGIPAQSTLRITVSDSVGFVFPPYIDTPNVGGLSVAAIDSIPTSPFTSAPLVSTGAFYGQLFCLTANVLNGMTIHLNNEAAVPSSRKCAANMCTASDWVRDPCSLSELARCGCSNETTSPVVPNVPTGALEISGFNLTENDTVFFVPENANCEFEKNDIRIQIVGFPATKSGYSGIASSDRQALYLPKIRGISSGIFNLCYYQPGAARPAQIGTIFVRNPCPAPLVYFEGGCDTGCPIGFVPNNGECVPVASITPKQAAKAVAITLTLVYPNADSLGLASLPTQDPTYIFFHYLMVQNLQLITDEPDASRFEISSITNGLDSRSSIPPGSRKTDTVCVTVIIKPATKDAERSPSELALLLYQLSLDVESAVYSNSFFKSIISQYSKIQNPLPVVYCESTKTYLAVCPFSISPVPANSRDVPPWFYTAAILAGILGGFGFIVLIAGVYKIDSVRTLLGTRKSAKNNIYNSEILKILEKDNDFSIIKIVRKSTTENLADIVNSSQSPPTSPTADYYKQVEELDPFAQATFARDWLEGRLLDISLFLNPKRRIKPPEIKFKSE